jgi:hypothetical protein
MLRKLAAVIAFSGLMSGVAFAGGTPATGIAGSFHDMNAVAASVDDVYGRSCVFCHTPHNADNTQLNAPLWNRAAGTLAVTPYSWVAPGNAAGGFDITDPLVGPSRLCMSCHDGTVAYDSHGAAGATAGTSMLSGARAITDLAVTHPIGFQYDTAATARTATEIVPSTTGFITSAVTSTFDTNTRTGVTYTNKKISDTLYSGFMTCASCHDVHNTVNAKPDAGHNYNYFLYAKQEGSAICLSCHVK